MKQTNKKAASFLLSQPSSWGCISAGMTPCHGLIGSQRFETNIMSSSSRAQSCVGSYYQVAQCHTPAELNSEVISLAEAQRDLSLLYRSVIISKDMSLFSC